MCNVICGDNRFEVIARAKEELISATNIEDSPDEMAVIDDFLFRCWQMDWLDAKDKVRNLNAENEKLKKLVRDLHACNGSCLRCLELMGKCEYEEQLGELGIGVLDE